LVEDVLAELRRPIDDLVAQAEAAARDAAAATPRRRSTRPSWRWPTRTLSARATPTPPMPSWPTRGPSWASTRPGPATPATGRRRARRRTPRTLGRRRLSRRAAPPPRPARPPSRPGTATGRPARRRRALGWSPRPGPEAPPLVAGPAGRLAPGGRRGEAVARARVA